MALVTPLEKGTSTEVDTLAAFFNETLGFTPNSVLTMQRRPEIATAFINLNKAVMANAGRVTSEQKRSDWHVPLSRTCSVAGVGRLQRAVAEWPASFEGIG